MGFYQGVVNNKWTLHVSHPSLDLLVMSGTIVTNGTFTNVQRLMDEYNDVVRLIGHNEIYFAFHNYGGLDGVGFTSTCGSRVTIENFKIDGKAARSMTSTWEAPPRTPLRTRRTSPGSSDACSTMREGASR